MRDSQLGLPLITGHKMPRSPIVRNKGPPIRTSDQIRNNLDCEFNSDGDMIENVKLPLYLGRIAEALQIC